MPDEAGLIDAPTEDVAAIDNAVDTAVDTSVDTPTDTGTDQPEGESGESLRGSALWREVKSLTQEGKPLTPKQLSALNKVIHANDAFSTKYPDGLKQIDGVMQAIKQLHQDESLPIEQAIAEAAKEVETLDGLRNLYHSGKPEFVDELVNSGAEAFQNIAPAVFRKYAEVNPDGYSKYVAQAVVSHMNGAQVPMQFQVLEAFWPQIPDFPGKVQFQNALKSVMDWTDQLKGMAAKQIEQKAIPNQQNGQPGTDLAAENAQLKMDSARVQWNSSVRTEGVSFVMSEAAKAAGKTPLSEKEKQDVLAKVGEELEARLTADRRYGEAMQGYLKAGNRSAYLQRIQSERKKLIPGAVRRAVGDVIEARPTNAPRQQQPANGAVKKPASTALAGAVQYTNISGHPKTLGKQIDLGRTTNAMLLRNEGYAVGEKPLYRWPKPRAK